MREYPPFARSLAKRLASGWRPENKTTLFISAGANSWRLAFSWARQRYPRRAFVCVPYGDDPAIYDWSIASGFDTCVAYDTGDLSIEHEETLATRLIWAGSPLVLVVRRADEPVAQIIRYRLLRSRKAA